MQLNKGTTVKHIDTKEEGLIISVSEGGFAKVILKSSGKIIYAHSEDLIPLSIPAPLAKKRKPSAPKEAPPTLKNVAITPTYQSQHDGIYLAFDPIFMGDDVPDKYLIFLLNAKPHAIIYGLEFHLGDEKILQKTGKLNAQEQLQLGELYYDELNENPSFSLDCCRITTDGTGERQIKKMKIKAKQFFKNVEEAPLLYRKMHVFQVFGQLQSKRKDQQGEDLKKYTQRQQSLMPTVQENTKFWTHDIQAKATFNSEIDLHIEALTENFEDLKKAEILQFQIKAFEDYIDQALKLGVDRVFIIHGVGTGKLRDAIATKLIQMRFIKTFKNEYHHKYGYGATEVVFD